VDILRNPTTVKLLAAQIIQACDLYIAKKLPEKQLKELFLHFASNHGIKLFDLKGINPTIINRIGKKRLELLYIMLEGYQQRLF
jgi:uncharacterized protein (TIGR04540 family)